MLRKILEILQIFQYAKIYERMENVSIDSLYRIYLFAAIIILRLLILKILHGEESSRSVFHFLRVVIVSVYYPVYLPFLLSKKILSCSLHFIRFLILYTLRVTILFLRFLLYLNFTFILHHLTFYFSFIFVVYLSGI